MTRVVHVLGETTVGGAENQALYLLRALRDRGLELELVFFRKGCQHERFAALGVPMHQIHTRGRMATDWHRRAWAARELITTFRPDILHTWLYETHLIGLLAALGRPQTRVLIAHRSGLGVPRSGRHLWALRLLRHRIDHALANSHAGAEVLTQLGLVGDRVSVIPNGLPIDRVAVTRERTAVRAELSIEPDAPVVCAVTRPNVAKDLPTLFGAFHVLRSVRPEARLVLIGPTAQELRHFGTELPEGAQAIGFRDQPADYMSASDIIAISSRTEGHSNVAAEGLMLGMPVATTNTGEHPALVRQAGGRVVPIGRSDALGAAFLELLEHPPQRLDVRAVAERTLSIDAVADATVALYAWLLSAPLTPESDVSGSCKGSR